jgi:hypothetical protein
MRTHRIALAAGLVLALVAARQRPSRPSAPPIVSGPTFSKEIVRIFQENCQTCHHPGDIAPFSLMTYHDTLPEALQIKLMVKSHQMPPWKPVAGCGDFANTRVLSQDAIDLITKWVDNGAPEGNPADLPAPLDFSSGWALGQPDLVLSYPQSYTPPASGDIYRCFPMPTNLTSDQYVAAIDIHPGDPKTVHHAIAFLDTDGSSQKLDDADPDAGYTCFGGPGFNVTNVNAFGLGGWAPGTRPVVLPDGVAMSLPAASRVVLQVHYHPHEATTKPDRTEIGIYFAKVKPNKLLRFLPLINNTFTIPPGASNYPVTASFGGVPLAAHIWEIFPHMHLLGRTMRVDAVANGQNECLIDIEDWDFNWQGMYKFNDPIAFPAFSTLTLKATYDNSADNPRNPNSPPRAVSWGEQTTDEMCIAFLGVTIDAENLQSGQKVDTSWIPSLPNR